MNKTLLSIVVLIVGLGAGFWFGQREQSKIIEMTELTQPTQEPLYYRSPMDPSITSPIPAKDSMGMDFEPVFAEVQQEKKSPRILFYRNPMDPSITSPTPAKDSMGMDFIPVFAEDDISTEPMGTVSIDPVMVQNIGVRTTVAEETTISRIIHTVGRVDYNEEFMARLHPKTNGWIEELFIDKTGERVEVDTILLNIYSPKLVSTNRSNL